MFRKELIERLEGPPLSIAALARELQVKPKALAEELEHVRRTLAHDPRTLVVLPAECRKCGFTFDPDKLTKPGKCPQCKGTWIQEPHVQVRRPND
ncbi:MAG: transcriptional regulator [Myxococcota bacterium]